MNKTHTDTHMQKPDHTRLPTYTYTHMSTHKFESGWEVGVIKSFERRALSSPHAGKFSVKYKDDPNWWTHSLWREGYGKDKHWVLLGLPDSYSA